MNRLVLSLLTTLTASSAAFGDAQKLLVNETFEGKNWSYKLPHKYDTSSKAGKLIDGALKVTIHPGTYGYSGDEKNGTERAEFAKQIIGGFNQLSRNKAFYMQFDARVDKGFKATKRTMISQIKVTDSSRSSPAAAIYLSDGGAAKCVNYNNTDDTSKHSQNHTSIKAETGIDVLDGNWYTFKVILKLDNNDGYCRILVDNKSVLEVESYDSQDKGASGVLARIGIYRDALSYSQSVYFDDWKVGAFTN